MALHEGVLSVTGGARGDSQGGEARYHRRERFVGTVRPAVRFGDAGRGRVARGRRHSVPAGERTMWGVGSVGVASEGFQAVLRVLWSG